VGYSCMPVEVWGCEYGCELLHVAAACLREGGDAIAPGL